MALSELTGSFLSSDKLFDGQYAETQDCHREGETFFKMPSIADSVAVLMVDNWADTPSRFGRLSYLDLFTLVSGVFMDLIILHSRLFC